MRSALRVGPLVLLLSLHLLPAAAGAFTLSVPADRVVRIGSASRLLFSVTNTDAHEGLSRLTLRFPSGYRVTGGSAPAGWTVEKSPGPTAEISFRTSDEAKCTGALAPKDTLVFGVEVIASASRTVTPDSLVSAQGEQSCRGVVLDPSATLPSWNRLGIEAALAAGPAIVGAGGVVTVTMTVTNLSTVELKDVSALLHSAGAGSTSGIQGPVPSTLTLAPGARGSLTWSARAASPGTVTFSGQALAKDLSSPPVRSDSLYVGDLEVSLVATPEQIVSGQEVQVQMTVRNRGPVRVLNVTPSSLTFDGTALASAPAGPSPASQPVLEPGESATFAWAATVSGKAGESYGFSGWASAEYGAIVSVNVASNRGALAHQEAAAPETSETNDGCLLLGGGVGGGAAVSTGGGTPAAVPSATLQFVALNNDGRSAGGAEFSGSLVRALNILVGWQNLSGAHSQRLEFFAPDGSLYQQFSTQIDGTPMETRLPVTGTWITQNSLFGAWRVEVFLDSGQMPITSGAFVLTP
jgi:hypothetical protein